MAKSSNSKNSFIIMLVAIIVVAAAIAFIVFEETTSNSNLFKNQNFAGAVAKIFDTAPAFLKQQDLSEVKYMEISYNSETEEATIAIGFEDFISIYREYMDAADAQEDTTAYIEELNSLFKSADFKLENDGYLDDIKLFDGIEIIASSGARYSTSSVFENMTQLTSAEIYSAGLTEVNGFAGLNPEKVDILSFPGNEITDWSALDNMKEKVIVNAYYTVIPGEDGTIDINNMVYVEQTLAEYYEELAKAEDKVEAEEAEAADAE